MPTAGVAIIDDEGRILLGRRFPDFTSVWDIEVFADGRIWIVGPIWAAEGGGAGTIVELDDTGAIMQLERLDAPEFIGPTGFANVWSITGRRTTSSCWETLVTVWPCGEGPYRDRGAPGWFE